MRNIYVKKQYAERLELKLFEPISCTRVLYSVWCGTDIPH